VSSKVGILGGSFDPPHIGHVAMAQSARETLGLDKVLLMPARRPPHKEAVDLSGWEHRLEMARLAARDLKGIEVSLHEESNLGASYTVETLRRFRELYDDEVYFILGADSLRDLPGWREPGSLLELATIVVFPRDGIDARLAVEGDASIVVFETPVIEVASSDVRRKRRAGDRIDHLVPAAVFEYIQANFLYTR
jgi:nicotinate-nucleotide adenylyltransferase